MKLVLDPERSNVRLRTFAEGLFSRLAHDLELSCGRLTGSGERAGDVEGSATLEAPIVAIDVAGTLKAGKVDPNGLSSSERADCIEKMRREVFHSQGGSVCVEARLLGGERARISIVPPRGRTVERSIPVKVTSDEHGVRVSGAFEVSLASIGSDPVKGPMSAFRVKDGVELIFDVVFVPA